MSQTLFEQITDIKNLEKAYKQTQKGKGKYKQDSMKFNLDVTYNLRKLRDDLIGGEYEFGIYVCFKVFEPKERIINAPCLLDKIVQVAINNIIKLIYQPCFIHDSYACIDEKGTHKAVDRVSYFMRKSSWEYGKGAFIVKLDIRKFFYSIDREILKRVIKKKIHCKQTLELIYKIIDSAKMIDVLGLPLGNTLSQICANIYMNELDQHCKRSLSLKYYVRYADDVIVIVKNKEEASRVLSLMIELLNDKLNLNVNERKTKIFPIEQGVNAYGFKIYKTHRLLRDNSKKKIKRKAKKMKRLIVENLMTVEKAEQILNSWLGHAKNGSSRNFINNLLEKRSYIYMNRKNVLKINTNIVNKEREKNVISQREQVGVMLV